MNPTPPPQVSWFLLSNGADPAIKAADGKTAYEVAPPSVQRVLKEEPSRSNSDLESQLLEAAKNGEIETVKVERVRVNLLYPDFQAQLNWRYKH